MKTKAVATCTDGMVRHFESCEALLCYENPLRAAFVSVEFSAQSSSFHDRAEVSIGQKYSSFVALSLHGEESNISELRRNLADVVDGMKPWYSWAATVSLFNFFFPLLFVCSTLFFLTSTFKINFVENSPGMPLSRAMLTVVVAVAMTGAVAGFFSAIQFLRTRYFPKISFAIGQGLVRHQTSESIRWVVVVGFVVSVVASIVVSVMFA